MIYRAALGFLGLFVSALLNAQDTAQQEQPLTISGYAEVYYVYDFTRPPGNTRPGFVYSHDRTGEVNVNLAFIKLGYHSDKLRGNIALATGTYMAANLAPEPGVLKNMYELNVGVKLSKTSGTWLDAGVLPSHIGIETATGKDNWTLTRSLVADNSPYYETGVRFSHTTRNRQWYFAALYLNGWQRIQRVNNNSTPAFGIQLTYKPSVVVTLNYSNFIGNDKPDSIRLMRYYHNMYAVFPLNQKWSVTIGFDYGMEQKTKGSSKLNNWYSPLLLVRYTPGDKDALSFRGEYYQDRNGVIIKTGTANGFDTYGWSINYDRIISDNAMWRIELRSLLSKDALFLQRNMSLSKSSMIVAAALALNF